MHNTIIALGHLVKDPETRTTTTGKNICTFRMCISDNNAKNKCFIDIEAWEKTADVCAKYLNKGREVLIEGELSVSSWTGKDGTQQNKYFIRANKVKFVGGSKKADSTVSSGASYSAPANDDVDDDIPF